MKEPRNSEELESAKNKREEGSVSEKKVVTRVKDLVLKEPETDCLAIDGVLFGIPSDGGRRGPSSQVDQDR